MIWLEVGAEITLALCCVMIIWGVRMIQFAISYINNRGEIVFVDASFADSITSIAKHAEGNRDFAVGCVRIVIDIALPVCMHERGGHVSSKSL